MAWTPLLSAVELDNGDFVTGAIDAPGDEDTYTFQGSTGDTVSLTLADINGGDPNRPGDLWPRLYLYGPNDDLLSSNWNYEAASITSLALPLNGTYTVRAKDYNNTRTGPYELHFAKAPGAAEHGRLVNGGSVQQTLTLGDLDTYTFDGSTGDSVSLAMADLQGGDANLPGDIWPQLYLYDPNGKRIATNWNYEVASITSLSLPLNGTYTVLAKDYAAKLTGPYEIHFARTPGAQEHRGLVNGGYVSESLTLGDLDTYTFHGETGESISLTLADLNGGDPNLAGDFWPQLYLYDPNGKRIANNWNYEVASITSLSLPLNGTYTVLAKDYAAKLTGPYRLHFVRSPGAREHDSLISGQQKTETLTLGDLDTYVFYAESGDTVSLVLRDLNGSDPNLPGDFWPQLYLFDPNGARVATTWNYDVASISNRPLTLTGTYTVLAKDYNAELTGPYSLDFTSTSTSVPSRVTLLAPVTGDAATRPVLAWTPSGYAKSYVVNVKSLIGTQIYRRLYRADVIGCPAAIDTCSLTLPVPVTDGARWWIRPLGEYGFGSWSRSRTFATVGGTPAASSVIAPIGSQSESTPVYEWARVPNATRYRIAVNDSTGVRIRAWVSPGAAGCAAPGTTCKKRFETSVTGTGRWNVRVRNQDGYGPWSARRTFQVN